MTLQGEAILFSTALVFLPDLAYHITQRGNRRQAVFFTGKTGPC